MSMPEPARGRSQSQLNCLKRHYVMTAPSDPFCKLADEAVAARDRRDTSEGAEAATNSAS